MELTRIAFWRPNSPLITEDCGWYGGSFKCTTNAVERAMRRAWSEHVAYVEGGGTIEHGQAANVDAKLCYCTRCSIPWRAQRRAAEETRT